MSNEVKMVRDTMIKPVAITIQIVCIVLIGAFIWQTAAGAAITLVATWLLFDIIHHACEADQAKLFDTPNASIKRN